MIISASRRTDIPAFYADWFIHRIQEQFVLVRNPMNRTQVRRISLAPTDVDCIVFWTKNPGPILDKLKFINNNTYYFQFTLTPYGTDIEPYLPDKLSLIEIFKKLSNQLGKNRVLWRYDPIILSSNISITDHVKWFDSFSKALSGYTNRCIISFLDLYKKTMKNCGDIGLIDMADEMMEELAEKIVSIAHARDIEIVTCAEKINLEDAGIHHGKCIDDVLISKLIGKPFNSHKDKSQRPECDCNASVDIGAYDTCIHGCRYCYANTNAKIARQNFDKCRTDSPFLITEI